MLNLDFLRGGKRAKDHFCPLALSYTVLLLLSAASSCIVVHNIYHYLETSVPPLFRIFILTSKLQKRKRKNGFNSTFTHVGWATFCVLNRISILVISIQNSAFGPRTGLNFFSSVGVHVIHPFAQPIFGKSDL